MCRNSSSKGKLPYHFGRLMSFPWIICQVYSAVLISVERSCSLGSYLSNFPKVSPHRKENRGSVRCVCACSAPTGGMRAWAHMCVAWSMCVHPLCWWHLGSLPCCWVWLWGRFTPTLIQPAWRWSERSGSGTVVWAQPWRCHKNQEMWKNWEIIFSNQERAETSLYSSMKPLPQAKVIPDFLKHLIFTARVRNGGPFFW